VLVVPTTQASARAAAERLQPAESRLDTLESMHVPAADPTAIGAQLDVLRAGDHDHEDMTIETGLWYAPGHPVRIQVRKRDGRYDFIDGAAAVSLAGRPDRWLATASDAVAEMGMNVNRRGVVFVTGFPRRDLAALALGLAECSRQVYLSLLEESE
jgi:hypothetical protein